MSLVCVWVLGLVQCGFKWVGRYLFVMRLFWEGGLYPWRCWSAGLASEGTFGSEPLLGVGRRGMTASFYLWFIESHGLGSIGYLILYTMVFTDTAYRLLVSSCV